MASIGIKTNLSKVVSGLRDKLEKLQDPEYLLRPVAFDLIDLMTQRIHKDGKAADGSPIGSYSSQYLKMREEKYGRMEGQKIVVSLTRQLEGDWHVIATDKGYGIGFLNSGSGKPKAKGDKTVTNLDKARFVEEIKNKKIFSLSRSELEYAKERFQELVNEALNS